jgi:hypothetical protein
MVARVTTIYEVVANLNRLANDSANPVPQETADTLDFAVNMARCFLGEIGYPDHDVEEA